MKDDNKFIKHFDSWTETKTLEYKVEGVYDCLDKLEDPKKETKESRVKFK